ncbi:MAG: SRPBCC family protein [Pyrinomonadaceae bacterium]
MQFIKETVVKAPPERVFDFHRLPDAIERLIPPWEDAEIIQRADISVIGSRAIIDTKLFGLVTTRWVAEHTAYDPPHLFEDVQISGPFAAWRHRHIIEPHSDGSMLKDEIEYEPPMWILGTLAAPFLIIPKIERMFCYRHEVTRKWCEMGEPQSESTELI